MNGKDCASNILETALALAQAESHLGIARDKTFTPGLRHTLLFSAAEELDLASSAIAAAVTVCELGPAGVRRSVEILALASDAKGLDDKRIPDLYRRVSELITDLRQHDFE